MNKALTDLIKISNIVGKDKTLVQGGGGNTSVKTADGKFMYIKASGTALKDMNEKNGWRKVDVNRVLTILQDDLFAKLDTSTREVEVVNRLSLACVDGLQSGARPSVEAHLHAILSRCIIHLHPDAVGAYVNAKNGKAEIEKLFKGEKKPPLWIPYVDPGFILAKKVAKLVAEYKKINGSEPSVIFLEKHGLFVSADTPDAALRGVRKVIKLCASKLKPSKSVKVKAVKPDEVKSIKLCIRRAVYEAAGVRVLTGFYNDEVIASFMARKDAKQLLSAGAITPDELVYANGPAVWLEKCNYNSILRTLCRQVNAGQKTSAAFLIKGVGLFVVGTIKTMPVIKDIVKSSMFIRTKACGFGGILALNKRQRDFINNWEAEAFRKTVAGGTGQGLLTGRVAVVTGAGSGLGRNIALGLAKDGANIALVDIDDKSAEQTSEIIKEKYPASATLVLKCDVTSQSMVGDTFNSLVENWGGLDILVNAAGVAPAFSLVDLPVEKWRFALEINLTGYYLMAQAAAKIMIEQQIGGSIVNISSKSGIDASKNNTPYNATKAGELHMSRGWAMELGAHNIRVNCICPGNVFEGSKIWNPEYIKVCAKKYGIKPEEVIPYYVNKTMLRREIKGQDIADGVVFLASDRSRMITAQTLVVDAGQAVVR